jgi:hypothetical protein
MPALFQSTVREFLDRPILEVVGTLSLHYAAQGFTDQKTDQTESWAADAASLQGTLRQTAAIFRPTLDWRVLLEFAIPRKDKRIDVVLLTPGSIIILELKTGAYASEALKQVEEYALLLHYFHKTSNQRRIFPIVVSPFATSSDIPHLQQSEFQFKELASTWIASTSQCNWNDLGFRLETIGALTIGGEPINVEGWSTGAYYPVPTIIEAALALREGLNIREIAHSEASEHEISAVADSIQNVILGAQAENQFAICFLTGVPGSGKTLVGLSLAHSPQRNEMPIHFMSGNGPLVKVLQHLFTQQAMKRKVPAPQARIQARTLIENVHLFARHYTDEAPNETPSNHVIIFDEAQRAWNREQNLKKFRRNYSEPEMLLSIMERHRDWAVVIALVGGGQEINDGEAGLEEWGRALQQNGRKPWRVFASPEVVSGGESTAGHRLFEEAAVSPDFIAMNQLHLRTSNRSLRAENLAKWVNAVISGDIETAAALQITQSFPIFLTRDLTHLKEVLNKETRGESRSGLVASSGAARLRAEGLEPDSAFHAQYKWEHWYLAGKEDVRTSFQLEVFATEFEIQGLELDWIGLCWGGDFIWQETGWLKRKFRPGPVSRWVNVKSAQKRIFRENAYRVLLTRARQGLVIFVPPGNPSDPTRPPAEFDSTASFLQLCGVKNIDSESREQMMVEEGAY